MARARTLTLKTQVEVKGADKLTNLGKKLQTTGKNLTVGLTLPLAALGGGLLALAEEAERADAELRRAFDSMGAGAWTTVDALKAQQQELQNLTTFGDEEISHLQSVLLTFGNVTGDSFDRATAAGLDMSAMLGQDLQSSAVQLGKALNDPIRGVTALRRVGVSFTEQQLEQIRVMQEAGDMMGAQGVILGELERQFGGAAEAMAGTAGGQMKQALNALSDAGEEFGAVLAPVLRDVANGVKDLAKWLQSLNPETKEWVVRIAAAVAALGPLLFVAGSFLRMIKLLVTAGGALRLAFLHIPTALGFVDLALAKTRVAMTLLLGPIGIAVAAVGALAAAFATDFLGVRTRFEKDMADIGNVLGDLSDNIDDFFGLAEKSGKKAERIFTPMTDAQWDAVEESGKAWVAHRQVISDAIYGSDGMVSTITQGADDMAAEMGEAPGKMADELLAAQQELSDATTQLVNFMEQALTPAQEKFRLQGFLSSKELAAGLASGNPLVRQKASELRAAAEARLAELNGFSYGYNLGVTFANGMNVAQGVVRTAAGNLAQAAVGQIGIRSEPSDPNSPLRGITKFGANLVKTYADSMLRELGTLRSAAGAVARTVAPSFGAAALSVRSATTAPLAGGAGTTVINNNFYLQWEGQPPRARNEAEIIATLQRLAPFLETSF